MLTRNNISNHKIANLLKCAILCIILFTSCNNGNKKPYDPDKPTVSVTIEPYRYFVEQIAGDDVNINVMVPAGSSPETYEPTARQMIELSNSTLYFKVGEIGFEKTWGKKLQQNAPKTKFIDTSTGIDLAKTSGGNIDPHTWMSLKSAEIITANIAGALIDMYPDKAKEYKKNYWNYRKHLNNLQDKMDKLYFSIADGRQTSFVIYHPILTYFAKDNGFEQYALEEEGREPSINQMQAIIDKAKEEDITVLFIQKEFANKNVQTFIKETGVKPIEINPLSYDWEAQMLFIMKCMTDARKSEKGSTKTWIRQSAEKENSNKSE